MKPKRFLLNEILSKNPSSVIVRDVVERINNGALFVYPTETIYGIGGIATPAVEQRIIKAKKRVPDNPMLLYAGDLKQFKTYSLELNKQAEKLARLLWPGNMTLVLSTIGSDKTIGIRVSDHPFIRLLSGLIDLPLYSTSANISGTNYINNPDTIYELFSDSIDFMIDAGTLPESLPSTIVDVSKGSVNIIREGAVSAEQIMSISDH